MSLDQSVHGGRTIGGSTQRTQKSDQRVSASPREKRLDLLIDIVDGFNQQSNDTSQAARRLMHASTHPNTKAIGSTHRPGLAGWLASSCSA